MQYNTATLNNGLRIIHLPNTSKIAYCGYQIKAGTRNEKPGDEGWLISASMLHSRALKLTLLQPS